MSRCVKRVVETNDLGQLSGFQVVAIFHNETRIACKNCIDGVKEEVHLKRNSMTSSLSTASRVQVSVIAARSPPPPETLSLKSSPTPPLLTTTMKNIVRGGCLAPSAIMPTIRRMRDLVHDEKMVVATLATLEAGGPSHLIKEELKLVIQSRREAEGKEALKVEFSPPEKNELTPIDVERRERRRERNRLAAQRSRERGKRKMDELMQEIDALQSRNNELEQAYTSLSDERDQLKKALLDHLSECSSYNQPLNLSLKNT